ncbi:MAG: pyridoxal-phosphate dependent enzyme [Caldilineaceae bacterium]|nr:pyridoxal-phosphate dependent enzyme [Caldilineaceae bacterium]
MQAIEVRDLYVARAVIGAHIRRTPLVYSSYLSAATRGHVYLKLENLQETGAFKVRGAANCLLQMDAEERARGVIALSTGNHGRALAWMGKRLGVRVVVCVPESVLPHKVAAMRALGAEVRVVGADQDAAEAAALAMVEREGLTWVSPFDDSWIIAGQGTIGLEILEDLPQVDLLLAPLSGGGLLGGIALAMKGASARIRTVGVAMARGPVMVASLAAGMPVQLTEEPTLADSLVGGIGLENRYTFELVRRVVDETVLVSEEEIGAAMVYALKVEKQVVEGGGVVALAALLHRKLDVEGQTVAVVVSGGNVDMAVLTRLLLESDRAGGEALLASPPASLID